MRKSKSPAEKTGMQLGLPPEVRVRRFVLPSAGSVLRRQSDPLFLRSVTTWLFFFVAVVLLQYSTGAYSAEFAGHPDEPAHYITGLMVRDYLAGGLPRAPMQFAEEYYLHYPKVALGHWPPFFYIVQAVWTLAFSPDRSSVLLLMAFIVAWLAHGLYWATRAEFGTPAGIAAGLMLVCLPEVRRSSAMVMADILVALLCLWSALSFGRFLASGRWQHAAWFGGIAALAVMTKGNALALSLVPLLAVALSGRFGLVRRFSFWLPALIVLSLCGPWYLAYLHMARNGWAAEPGIRFTLQAISGYSSLLTETLGIGVLVMALVGIVVRLLGRQARVGGKWAALGALVLAVLVFDCVVPATIEGRLLIPALAPLLMFSFAGIAAAAQRLCGCLHWAGPRATTLTAVLLLSFSKGIFAMPRKPNHGMSEVAQTLVQNPGFRHSAILVSSEGLGEGAFIAEVAMRERRPGHIVLRASKVLATNVWNGTQYRCRFRTPEEVAAYLESIPVGLLVIHRSHDRPSVPHHRLLLKMLEGRPRRWDPIPARSPRRGTARGPAVQTYRLAGYEGQPPDTLRLDLRPMIDKVITLKDGSRPRP